MAESMENEDLKEPAPSDAAAESDLGRMVEALSGLELPLEVGSLEVDDLGTLVRRGLDRPLHFTVGHAGFLYHCALDPQDQPEVSMTAELGAVPYTAESPWARALLSRVVEQAGVLPSGRLTLEEGGLIRLALRKRTPTPCSTLHVLATITALLLEVKGYAEMLRFLVRHPADEAEEEPGDLPAETAAEPGQATAAA